MSTTNTVNLGATLDAVIADEANLAAAKAAIEKMKADKAAARQAKADKAKADAVAKSSDKAPKAPAADTKAPKAPAKDTAKVAAEPIKTVTTHVIPDRLTGKALEMYTVAALTILCDMTANKPFGAKVLDSFYSRGSATTRTYHTKKGNFALGDYPGTIVLTPAGEAFFTSRNPEHAALVPTIVQAMTDGKFKETNALFAKFTPFEKFTYTPVK